MNSFRHPAAIGIVLLATIAAVAGGILLARTRHPAPATSATASIEGTLVFLATRQPAPGVKVTLREGTVTAVTDNEGRFLLSEVTPGWQTVLVENPDFITASQTLHLAPGQKGQVALYLQPLQDHVHGASNRVPDLCASCHAESGKPALIGGGQSDVCFNCHQGDYPRFSNRLIFEQTPHAGDCTGCHSPHGINNYHRHLVTVSTPTDSNPTCYRCHSVPGQGNTAGFPGEREYLRPGNPHSHPNPTRVDVHPVNFGTEAHVGECYNCHNPHGATEDGRPEGRLTPALTRATEERLCVQCHTYFGPRVAQGTKHSCTLCHNPHLPRRDGVILLKKPGAATEQEFVKLADFYGQHKGFQLVKDEYCLGCHLAGGAVTHPPAAPDPFGEASAFRNAAPDPRLAENPARRNLHAVHTGKVLGAGPTDAESRVWCAECHDLHPNAPTASNPLGRKLLRTNVIVTLEKGGAGYAGQRSCGMADFSPCHREGASR